MDAFEYIDTVTGQMRCKRARAMVAKELADHISDQTEDYIAAGMTGPEAASEAVRQMGDPVQVGMEMDRLHRPGMDKRTLIMVGVLSLAAMFMQTAVIRCIRSVGTDAAVPGAGTVPFQILAGLVLMMGILYLDYTLLGKHPVAVWVGMMAAAWILQEGIGPAFVAQSHRIMMYLILGLFLPAYAGIVWHYRTGGWLGFAAGALWLFAAVFFYIHIFAQVSLLLLTCFAGLLLLSYALAKGWYGIPKLPSLLILWGTTVGAAVLWGVVGSARMDYFAVRLKQFLFAAQDPQGGGYITVLLRSGISGLRLLGSGGSWAEHPAESAMSFFLVMNQWGIAPGVLVLLGLSVLLVFMLKGVNRQKNVLGSLLGMACILGLAVPALAHVLSCLSLIPYTDMYIPFLYPGWVANAASYTMLGLYLSVYRYKDVVA